MTNSQELPKPHTVLHCGRVILHHIVTGAEGIPFHELAPVQFRDVLQRKRNVGDVEQLQAKFRYKFKVVKIT